MSKARGELFLFTDDDVTPDRKWLTCMLAASKRWPQEAIFGGRIEVAFPECTPAWIRHLSPPYVNRAYAAYAPADEEGIVRNSPTGPNFMVRRERLKGMRYEDRIGPAGSNYAMGSETELLLRMQDEGMRFVYVPSATVIHRIRPDQVTLSWLLGRAHRAGRGAERLNRGDRKKIFGYTWTGAVRTLVAGPVYFCSRPLADNYRFKVGWQYYLGLGQMYENRMMKREAR
jgi:GT2 family glycosyltransferase